MQAKRTKHKKHKSS